MPMLMTLRMRLPVCPIHAPERTWSAKAAILSEHGVHLRARRSRRRPRCARSARRAQRDVQHGAVLGDVDLLAAKHRLDARAQPALLGELRAAGAASRR